MPQPAVFAGSPDSLDNYDTFNADGITVYVRKGTQTENGSLTITVVKNAVDGLVSGRRNGVLAIEAIPV